MADGESCENENRELTRAYRNVSEKSEQDEADEMQQKDEIMRVTKSDQ